MTDVKVDKSAIESEIQRLYAAKRELSAETDGDLRAQMDGKILEHKKVLRSAKPLAQQISALEGALEKRAERQKSLEIEIFEAQEKLQLTVLEIEAMKSELQALKLRESEEKGATTVPDPQQAQALQMLTMQVQQMASILGTLASIPHLPPAAQNALGAFAQPAVNLGATQTAAIVNPAVAVLASPLPNTAAAVAASLAPSPVPSPVAQTVTAASTFSPAPPQSWTVETPLQPAEGNPTLQPPPVVDLSEIEIPADELQIAADALGALADKSIVAFSPSLASGCPSSSVLTTPGRERTPRRERSEQGF